VELTLPLVVEAPSEDTDGLESVAAALAAWAIAPLPVDFPSAPVADIAPKVARNSAMVSAATRRRRMLTRRARARRRWWSAGEWTGLSECVEGIGSVSDPPLCSACAQPGNQLSARERLPVRRAPTGQSPADHPRPPGQDRRRRGQRRRMSTARPRRRAPRRPRWRPRFVCPRGSGMPFACRPRGSRMSRCSRLTILSVMAADDWCTHRCPAGGIPP
jgi:hypothetical protein